VTERKPRPKPKRANSKGESYKRSWRNLLLNKRYQLRFTLFMVGLSIVLMSGLVFGTSWIDRVWPDAWRPSLLMRVTSKLSWGGVRGEADEATRVGEIGVLGEKCVDVPTLVAEEEPGIAPTPMATTHGADIVPPPPPPPPPESDDGEEHHAHVVMTDESMTLVPVVPPDFGKKVIDHWTCEAKKWWKIDQLWVNYMRILWVLVASCLLLVVGLAVYGIKTTHKVAGPLFKVSLYFAKMRDGRLDKVYNLRKGDQLVSFYEHFKSAHAGVVAREREDIAQLEAIVAAAKDAGLGDHDAIKRLRALIARKEKSIA
jgi:hypothetical protein